MPVLRDPAVSVKDHAYHCYPRGNRLGQAIRTARYRLVRWTPTSGDARVDYELFDYQVDPLEKKNLADKHPEIVQSLLAKLESHPAPLSRRR